VTPETFVHQLEQLTVENGVPFKRLFLLADAEREFAAAMCQYKGYAALSNTSKCFFLETVERFNREVWSRVTTPLASYHHGLLMERLVNIFQSLRAAEIAALNGYPMQGYILLRNVYDSCVLTSGALQGLTDFERLEGISPGTTVDRRQAKKNRKKEEQEVRRQIDGKDSGLSADTIALLKTLNDLYDEETHASLLSRAQSLGWFKGSEPLLVTPAFSELKISIFINRHLEIAWMAHRLLPLIQLDGLLLTKDWSAKWTSIDQSFERAVMSITVQLEKPVGASVCEFVKSKFPFAGTSTFPK
jgi:hypothetical protein